MAFTIGNAIVLPLIKGLHLNQLILTQKAYYYQTLRYLPYLQEPADLDFSF
jgi:hypothetical protein